MRPFLSSLFVLAVLAGCGGGEKSAFEYTGTAEARVVRVSAQTAGTITSVLIDDGDDVRVDSVLATVRVDKLELQAAQAGSVREELAHQRAALEAQIAAARITRENLHTRLQRLEALLRDNATTRQSVDDARAQLDASDAQIRGLQKQHAALGSKEAQTASTVGLLKTQIGEATIVAPLNGRVLVRYADPGELAMPGTPICDIADLRSMWTRIYIAETDLPSVSVGQKATIRIDGASDVSLHGTVTWISDKAEFTPKTILTEETRTTLVFAAKVRLDNPDGKIKIGMPLTVTLDTP